MRCQGSAARVGEIDQVSAAIAAAMEEQSAATQEISRAVGQAAAAAQSVTEMMGGVVQIASETDDKAARLHADADGLAASTGRSRHTLIETAASVRSMPSGGCTCAWRPTCLAC